MNIEVNPDGVFINGHICKKHFRTKTTLSIWYCREIYSYRNILIKLDDDLKQSTQELRLLCRVTKSDLKYFPIVIDGKLGTKENPGWIAEKRIYPVYGRRPDWAYEIIEKISHRYRFSDIESRNWCMTKNGPVVYDWGI